jgi:hypothetical protein
MKRALAERAKQQTNEQQLQQRTAAHHLSSLIHLGGGQANTSPRPSNGGSALPLSYPNVDTVVISNHLHSLKQKQKEEEGDDVTSPTSGDTPPSKIARTDKGESEGRSVADTSSSADGIIENDGTCTPSLSSPLLTTKKTSKKRIRPPASVLKSERGMGVSTALQQQQQQQQQQDSQNVEESSAFYLKHQNKALASELYQYRYTIGLLSTEREKRRQECRKISSCLKELVGVWDVLEGELCTSLGRSERSIGANVSVVCWLFLIAFVLVVYFCSINIHILPCEIVSIFFHDRFHHALGCHRICQLVRGMELRLKRHNKSFNRYYLLLLDPSLVMDQHNTREEEEQWSM